MTATSVAAEEVLVARRLSKTFQGVRALDSLDLVIRAGEVRALAGQNGSGKSTLIKIIAGIHHADTGGELYVDGTLVSAADDKEGEEARRCIRFVHQDLGLVLELNAYENLAARHAMPWSRLALTTQGKLKALALELLKPFGMEIDVGVPVGNLTPIERSVIALSSAISTMPGEATPRLLVLDEPTAALPPSEVTILLDIIRTLGRRGVAVLLVSHRTEEIFSVADRVTVLRDGHLLGTYELADVTREALVQMLVGNKDLGRRYERSHERGGREVALAARGIEGRYLRGIDLIVRKGEILGIAGLAGSGSHELPYCLAGAGGREAKGFVCLPAKSAEWRDITGERGPLLPIVPAARLGEGIFGGFSIRENLTCALLDQIGRYGFISRRKERETSRMWMERLDVRSVLANSVIEAVSGGNQQKIILGRCLAQGAPVITLCEPTAGVDVGAREALYDLLLEAAAEDGAAAVVSSSDLTDLLALCTRVLVIRDGLVASELTGSLITEAAMLHAMEGR